MTLRVSRPALDRMIVEAARTSPAECCGILFGDLDLIQEARPATNVAADPRHRFEIDPQALVDAHRAARRGGARIAGYFHSHPGGSSAPSATDRTLAPGDGMVWAIVGETGVTFWRDEERGFVRLSYAIEDR